MHRVENLHRRSTVQGFFALVLRIAAERKVTFVVHGPTEDVLRRSGRSDDLAAAGVEIVSLLPHREFTRLLAAAPLVVTDGGSVQEECALLGVPTLLWRHRTERSDGLGENVVLTNYEPACAIDPLLGRPRALPPAAGAGEGRPSPAEVIADHLVAEAASSSRSPSHFVGGEAPGEERGHLAPAHRLVRPVAAVQRAAGDARLGQPVDAAARGCRRCRRRRSRSCWPARRPSAWASARAMNDAIWARVTVAEGA